MANRSNNRLLVALLAFVLVIVLVAFIVLVTFAILGRPGDRAQSVSAGDTVTPPPLIPLVPTLPTTTLPPPTLTAIPYASATPTQTPQVAQNATVRVIAGAGVNVRTGPGVDYPIVSSLPQDATARVAGRSTDALWWVIQLAGPTTGLGWVDGRFVEDTNADDVPVVPAPPTPTPPPTTTYTPTPTALPPMVFTASRTRINAGEGTLLSWFVQNVQAVYMYPVGAAYLSFPVTGVGSREVRPFVNTTYELRVEKAGNTIELHALPIFVAGGLDSARWQLVSYALPDGAMLPPLPDTEISASFSTEGTLSGESGCNSYSGRFQAYEDLLTIGPLRTTQRICDLPQGIMEQELAYFALLANAATFEIAGDQLFVRDLAGETLLIYVAG